jgi:hypothetical protein
VQAVGAGLAPARESESAAVQAVGAGLAPARESESPAVYAVGAGLAPAHEGAESPASPSLSAVVGAFKSLAAHAVGRPLWQRSFHDHVIRDEDDLARVRRYIDENPLRWSLDELHPDATTTP